MKVMLVPFFCHLLKLSTPPVGLGFIMLLAGTLLAIIILLILSFLIRKHAYTLAVIILIVLLALEVLSYPVGTWFDRLDHEQPLTESPRRTTDTKATP